MSVASSFLRKSELSEPGPKKNPRVKLAMTGSVREYRAGRAICEDETNKREMALLTCEDMATEISSV